jgi:small subunit ribosomal protein S7e
MCIEFLLQGTHKNQPAITSILFRLTRELEKKFSDRHVVFVAQRRIMAKPTRTSRAKQMRPRSRTLTSVHEKLLEDLVYPTEITGKRTRVQTDQKKIIKVYVFPHFSFKERHLLEFRTNFCFTLNPLMLTINPCILFSSQNSFLDAKDSTSLEYKLDTFCAVYRRLTGKEVVFEFPAHHAE